LTVQETHLAGWESACRQLIKRSKYPAGDDQPDRIHLQPETREQRTQQQHDREYIFDRRLAQIHRDSGLLVGKPAESHDEFGPEERQKDIAAAIEDRADP